MGNQKSLDLKDLSCNSFQTKSGNIVWAAAMQLAWNELSKKFASDKPILLATTQKTSLEIINNLNKRLFTEKDIDNNCIYIKSGYGQATVDTINNEVKAKFPKKTISPLQDKLCDTDIIAYAYLFKQIQFEVKFQANKEKEFKFNGKEVRSFYGKNAEQKKQVLVHHYADQADFVVQIKGRDKKDSLFLIKNHKIQSVQQAIRVSISAVKQKPQPLKKNDVFQMPVISFDVKREYTELIGLKFANEELKEYFIRNMAEVIKLSIDQNGARVQNQAKIIAFRCAELPQQKRLIILNESFWVVMKEAGKKPYLCAFVNNPEEMQ